ncbi:MAG: glycosyltransferase family 4 protein [Candidatus Saccharibacteria bacterium]|nr:glycosyltransferase family 4 protein [Candidatus Saccharibacteria bacterium]
MNIVWLSWKDIHHPEAGGAELVSDRIRQNLVKDGHTVTLLTASYASSKSVEKVNGVRTLRQGGKFSVYMKARQSYKKISEPVDLIIDEMNTIPFFGCFYPGSAKKVLLTYQLARSVWFYQIMFPLSIIGYTLEPLYLRLLSKRYALVLTESESTKTDLQHYGFKAATIEVFRVGMETSRPAQLPNAPSSNSIVFLGALRPMKRPIDAIRAFESARDDNSALTLTLAGNTNGSYAKKVIAYVAQSRHRDHIVMAGRVSEKEKTDLLRNADAILVTSIKEGWGLIVTEANSQGTPAVVYDADGLRDSVLKDKTGKIVPSGDFAAMGATLNKLLKDPIQYSKIRKNAFEHSKQFTFKNSYADFCSLLGMKKT